MTPMLATGLIADDPSFLDHMFSGFDTQAIDNFVCETMRDSCPDVWAANNLNRMIARGFQESYSLEPDYRRDPSQRIQAIISPGRLMNEVGRTQLSRHFKTI